MREFTIKGSSIIREILIWVGLLILAFFTNVYAISVYDGQWSELRTQLHIVLLLSLVYYLVVALIRAFVFGAVVLFRQMTGLVNR